MMLYDATFDRHSYFLRKNAHLCQVTKAVTILMTTESESRAIRRSLGSKRLGLLYLLEGCSSPKPYASMAVRLTYALSSDRDFPGGHSGD